MLIFFPPFGPLISLIVGPWLVFALAVGLPKTVFAICFAVLF